MKTNNLFKTIRTQLQELIEELYELEQQEITELDLLKWYCDRENGGAGVQTLILQLHFKIKYEIYTNKLKRQMKYYYAQDLNNANRKN